MSGIAVEPREPEYGGWIGIGHCNARAHLKFGCGFLVLQYQWYSPVSHIFITPSKSRTPSRPQKPHCSSTSSVRFLPQRRSLRSRSMVAPLLKASANAQLCFSLACLEAAMTGHSSRLATHCWLYISCHLRSDTFAGGSSRNSVRFSSTGLTRRRRCQSGCSSCVRAVNNNVGEPSVPVTDERGEL